MLLSVSLVSSPSQLFNVSAGRVWGRGYSLPSYNHVSLYCSSSNFNYALGDGTLRLWDSTTPPHSTAFTHCQAGELLTCDWSKYDQNHLFTAGVDTNVRLWDIRQLSAPVLVMGGHMQAVRGLKCDPFRGNIVVTCSYDFTVKIWDISRVQDSSFPLLETISHHSEFTYGLDLCSLTPGKVSSMDLKALCHDISAMFSKLMSHVM